MAEAPLSDDIVFAGARFDVRRVAFAGHDGAVVERELVTPRDAVVIVPTLDADTVVLIRNRRPAVGQTLWELPAGTLEPGEDAAACAGRELTEETGYRAKTLSRLTAFYSSPGFCTELLTAFVARDLVPANRKLDDTEWIEVEPTPWAAAMDMIRGERIRDGKTIAALLYFQALGHRPHRNDD